MQYASNITIEDAPQMVDFIKVLSRLRPIRLRLTLKGKREKRVQADYFHLTKYEIFKLNLKLKDDETNK